MENILQVNKQITIDGKEYTIRRLNTRDVIKVALIIGKVYRPGLGANSEDGQSGAIISAFMTALASAENDVIKLFADLMGITVEEFDSLPPDTVIDIIDFLSESDDLKRFLDKAMALAKKMGLVQEQK